MRAWLQRWRQMAAAVAQSDRRALLITLITLVALLAIWLPLTAWYRARLMEEKRAELTTNLTHDGNALIAALNRRVVMLQSLGAFVVSHRDEIDPHTTFEMDQAMAWLYERTSGTRFIAIAPGGVQSTEYPPTGVNIPYNMDLLREDAPQIKAAVQRAVSTQNASIVYMPTDQPGQPNLFAFFPVFDEGSLWGLVTMGMDLETILAEADLKTESANTVMGLRDEWGRNLYGQNGAFQSEPLVFRLLGTQDNWTLALAPAVSWDALILGSLLPFEMAGLAFLGLLTAVVFLVSSQQTRLKSAVDLRTEELRRAHDQLEERVAERTQELSVANAELHAEIIERQRVEERLRESEGLYRTLIMASPDAVTVTDREGRITFASEKVREIFAYDDLAEIIGEPLIGGVAEDDRPHAQAALARLLDGAVTVDTRQLIMRRKNGSTFIGEVDSARLVDANNEPTGIVSITRDITRRVAMQDELARSEARFRSLIEDAPVSIWLSRGGRTLYLNSACVQMFGYAEADLKVANLIDLVAPADRDELKQYIQHSERGEYAPRSFEAQAVRRDGTLFSVHLALARIDLPDGPATISFFTDITERKRAEEELRRAHDELEARVQARTAELRLTNATLRAEIDSRQRVQEALRHSEQQFRTVADFTYDWEYWMGPDQRLIYISPSCERVTGYSAAEFLAQPALFNDIIYAEDRERVADHTHQSLEGGELVPIDFRIVRRDGRLRWVGHVCRPVFDEHGHALGRRVSNRDITERRQAEDALREQEKLYRSIFDTTADGLVISDLEGSIIEANPAFCAMHGVDCGEAQGRRITSYLHPAHRHVIAQCIAAVNCGRVIEAQTVNLRKDDQPFHVEVRAVGLTYYGQPHVLYVFRDVSEQLEAYMRLEQRVQERTHELRMLLEFSHNMTRTLEMQPLLRLILNQLRSVVDYTGASILSIEGRNVRFVAHQGSMLESDIRQLQYDVDSPLVQALLNRSHPVIIADVLGDSPLTRAYRETFGEEFIQRYSHVRSWMGIPLVLSERVVGALAVSHLQVDYFTQQHADLALAFANQAVMAIENARLYEQAKDLAAIQERQRLARDLHDSVSQTLFSASLTAQVLPRLWERHRDEGQQCLTELGRLTRGALAEMRTLLVELRPNVLVESKLGDLLRQLAEAMTSRTRVPVEVITNGQAALPADVQIALYRLAQEALNNIAKHANARHAVIEMHTFPLDREPGVGVELSITDDGRGFRQEGISAEHLGLAIMRERAEAVKAALCIQSEPGRGTRVVVTWPQSHSSEQP